MAAVESSTVRAPIVTGRVRAELTARSRRVASGRVYGYELSCTTFRYCLVGADLEPQAPAGFLIVVGNGSDVTFGVADAGARDDESTPVAGDQEPRRVWWRRRSVLWIGAAILLFLCDYRHAASRPVSSDGAVNVLQAADLLPGNLLLTHWQVSDVSFYLSDLPLYAVLVLIFGPVPAVVHVGAAIVFSAVVLLAAALAKSGFTGRE